MKILFLSQWFPYPPDNGSKIRVYNLLRGLSSRHAVTLVCFTSGEAADANHDSINDLCHEVHVLPWRPFNPRGLRAVLGYLNPKPRYVVDTLSVDMRALIKRLLAQDHYDLVIASALGMAGYASAFQGVPALMEEAEHGIFYQRYASSREPARRLRHGLTWLKQSRYTAGLLRYFKAATVVSQPERDLLSRVAPGFKAVEVIPNCINLADYAGFDQAARSRRLVFTGSLKFAPNAEAMRWFLEQVYPKVAAAVPDVELAITGDSSGVPLPAGRGVSLTGYLQDIRPLVGSSWASLAPIQTGGGTRLKILEAMALKTPVIATSKGAEGLDVTHGKDILIADTPQAFADAAVELLRDPGLRESLAASAYQLVLAKYDWAAIMPGFLRLVESTAGIHGYHPAVAGAGSGVIS